MAGWLAGWLAGLLAGCLAGCLAGLAGLLPASASWGTPGDLLGPPGSLLGTSCGPPGGILWPPGGILEASWGYPGASWGLQWCQQNEKSCEFLFCGRPERGRRPEDTWCRCLPGLRALAKTLGVANCLRCFGPCEDAWCRYLRGFARPEAAQIAPPSVFARPEAPQIATPSVFARPAAPQIATPSVFAGPEARANSDAKCPRKARRPRGLGRPPPQRSKLAGETPPQTSGCLCIPCVKWTEKRLSWGSAHESPKTGIKNRPPPPDKKSPCQCLCFGCGGPNHLNHNELSTQFPQM